MEAKELSFADARQVLGMIEDFLVHMRFGKAALDKVAEAEGAKAAFDVELPELEARKTALLKDIDNAKKELVLSTAELASINRTLSMRKSSGEQQIDMELKAARDKSNDERAKMNKDTAEIKAGAEREIAELIEQRNMVRKDLEEARQRFKSLQEEIAGKRA